jgi:hypothetical protein
LGTPKRYESVTAIIRDYLLGLAHILKVLLVPKGLRTLIALGTH